MISEADSNQLTIIRASRHLDIPGYMVDKEALEKIDGIAESLAEGPDDLKCTYEMRLWSPTSKRSVFECKDLGALLPRMEVEGARIESLFLRYSRGRSAGISVFFDSDGTVETRGFSHAPDFQLEMDRLIREIRECDQQYGWATRTLVYGRRVRRIMAFLLVFLSLLLPANIGFYFYARHVGVNVDPSIIPAGETIAKRVEAALKTNDVNEKLDVLLAAHLKGFTNIRDVLAFHRAVTVWLLVGLVVTTVSIVLLKVSVSLYPRAFFRFGNQERVWSRLQRRRDIWGIVIVIGFVVNVVAGLVVAILTKSP